jgi:hypothetical protein
MLARLDAPAPQSTIRIDDVRVGTCHRRDLGDIAGLAASIGELIAGMRTAAMQP